MIDRTGYMSKRFETPDAKDFLLVHTDRVHRSMEGKFQ
jgi:hypothetical protein